MEVDARSVTPVVLSLKVGNGEIRSEPGFILGGLQGKVIVKVRAWDRCAISDLGAEAGSVIYIRTHCG